jgi:VRR-NUC domain
MSERISITQFQNLRPRRRPVEREHFEQVALFNWAYYQSRRMPELGLLYAIPNGGKRTKAVAGKLKAEGVKAGVPDICLPVARGEYHGLYIELKAEGGRASDSQRSWMAALAAQMYRVHLCVGWRAAKKVIEEYLQDAAC